MAKRAHEALTDRGCQRKKAGRHPDGNGLFLLVSNTGIRAWAFRWKEGGRGQIATFGHYPEVGLLEARKVAAECRLGDPRMVLAALRRPRKGIPTFGEKGIPTFGQCAAEYIATHEVGWRSAKYRWQWAATVLGQGTGRDGNKTRHDYCASLRDKPVSDITKLDVLEVLEPIWLSKTKNAAKTLQRIERVLDYAKARHRTEKNATHWPDRENAARWRGQLSNILPKPNKVAPTKHQPAVPYPEMPALMARLRSTEGVAARAIEFAILTAGRSGEVRGATWGEIDMTAKLWTVPGERMKAGLEHRVPLSKRAVAVLREAEKMRMHAGPDALVFPGLRDGRPLSGATLAMVLRRLVVGVTVHGTARSSFRDWAGDCTAFPRDLIEQALAHVIADKTEAAYRRSDALERRRELMEAWAGHCDPKAGNVVRMRRRR
jgi:integrase